MIKEFVKKNWIWVVIVMAIIALLFLKFMKDRRRQRNALIDAKLGQKTDKVKEWEENEIGEITKQIKGLSVDEAKSKVGGRYKIRVCSHPKREIKCSMEFNADRLTVGLDEKDKIISVNIG
jgi:FtsZ-interacting cell division protein ZipA